MKGQSIKDSEELATPHPSATVIPLRESGNGFEILLIHRNPRLSFHGGAWVFPGGRIDPEDYAGSDDTIEAARRAAVRETKEEAGILINPEGLVLMSRWTTPESQPRRFTTWFFVAAAPDQEIHVDGGETLDYRWVSPKQALSAQRTGEILLMPPTFVSIENLSEYASIKAIISDLTKKPPQIFLPRVRTVPGGFCTLYQDDVAYDGGDINQPGKHHRFWGVETGWRYERTE